MIKEIEIGAFIGLHTSIVTLMLVEMSKLRISEHLFPESSGDAKITNFQFFEILLL